MNSKTIIKNTIILFIITLVSGFLLGGTYELTADARAQQEKKTTKKAYKSVFENADSFEDVEYDKDLLASYLEEGGYDSDTATIDGAVKAIATDKSTAGYVITITDKNGYSGDITFTLGITSEGDVTGIEFLTLEETAGMGMKAKESSFKDQFKSISVSDYDTSPDSYLENGIDAISGATITTKAVSNGVSAGILCFNYLTGGDENE